MWLRLVNFRIAPLLLLVCINTVAFGQSDLGVGLRIPDQRALMESALQQYQMIAERGGWPSITPGTTLQLGDESPRSATLQERLIASGDLSSSQVSGSIFSQPIENAVKHFQMRHGLAIDGVVGKETLTALNVPVSERIHSLLINLERARLLMENLGAHFILVNIAGFEIVEVKDGVITFRAPVVVGKAYQQTPIFSDSIKYVEFNPYWNVPTSILRNELLPALKKDSHHLVSDHMRFFRRVDKRLQEIDPAQEPWSRVTRPASNQYSARQDPGPWNPLGVVKFGFPNQFDVYLHDTPARQLYQKPTRTFSHGCIRVANALGLAQRLLSQNDPAWSSKQIDAVVESGENRVIKLTEPVPIYITYRTSWVDLDGSINFRRDVYGRDAAMER